MRPRYAHSIMLVLLASPLGCLISPVDLGSGSTGESENASESDAMAPEPGTTTLEPDPTASSSGGSNGGAEGDPPSSTSTSSAPSTTSSFDSEDETSTGASANPPRLVPPLPPPRPEPVIAACTVGDQVYGSEGERCPANSISFAATNIENACGSCACTQSCEVDADCPQPDTGNGTATCFRDSDRETGFCLVGCDETTQCPDSTQCAVVLDFPRESILGQSVCQTVEQDRVVCDYFNLGAGPCAQYTDEATCNTVTSTSSPLRCRWVEEQIYDGDSTSCDPVRTEQRCILTETMSTGEEEFSCAGSGCAPGWSSYVDTIAAGTFRLFDLPCDERPHARQFFGTQCGPELDINPLLCDCGIVASTCE